MILTRIKKRKILHILLQQKQASKASLKEFGTTKKGCPVIEQP